MASPFQRYLFSAWADSEKRQRNKDTHSYTFQNTPHTKVINDTSILDTDMYNECASSEDNSNSLDCTDSDYNEYSTNIDEDIDQYVDDVDISIDSDDEPCTA